MPVIFLFTALFFTVQAHSAPLDQLAGQISRIWQANEKRTLALGEASHHDPNSIALLKEVIVRNAFDIGYVALDLDPNQYDAIESFLADIHRSRRRSGLFPLRVIKLDLNQRDWYSRAPVKDIGLSERDVRNQRGIVYSQANHASGNITGAPQVNAPGVQVEYGFQSLESLYADRRVMRVYLNTRRTMSETLMAALSFEYINSHSSLIETINPAPGALIPTYTEEFRELESIAGDSGRDALSRRFDYLAQLDGLSCEGWLNPL